jgi:hypothetical protein
MNKGGYQIIDLKGIDRKNGVGMVDEGIYDKIEGTRKPILVSGLVLEGQEYHDFYAQFTVSGSSYVYSDDVHYNIDITITDNDVVTLTER